MFSNWFGGTRNKYTLQHLRYLHSQLVKFRDSSSSGASEQQVATCVENLRSLSELMIYGDKHNEQFFEFFCEKNMLTLLMNIIRENNLLVQVQVIQSMSILVQNMTNETAVYYLLSNNHINDIIRYGFDFSCEELQDWFASFLKALSLRLNTKTVQFFFNQPRATFPLYTRALDFVNHQEPMVRIAMRTLTLNVYRVQDDAMRAFLLRDARCAMYFE